MKNNIQVKKESLFCDPLLPLVVVITRTNWDELPRMRHQVTRQLMRFYNVIYIDLSDFGYPKKDMMKKTDDKLLIFSPGINIYIPKRLYANELLTHHLVNNYYKRKIINFLSLFSMQKIILINFIYDFWEIMDKEIFIYQLYVCFDEFPKMWRSSKEPNKIKYFYQSRLFQHYENRVAVRADRCLASHIPLVEKLKRYNQSTILFLHGHEFNNPIERQNSYNKDISSIKIGFMGYITDRLITEWLLFAMGLKNIEVNLIGPINEKKLNKFIKKARFNHIPSLFSDQLLQKLMEMDVLVMPYDPGIPENQVQTVSNKFFQYLAAGRPVVMSDMPYYIDMPDGVIYRAKTANEFVDKIRQAYEEDSPDLVRLRLKIAAENTWHKRGDLLHTIIEKDLLSSN